ncbi:2-oxoacid dehydrogenases acyltransferase-domain-containing protein [Yarrowia lipolytica]|uniref:Dihydrolipoamide acetyltransferase component of pyruvate dehydrogenase complex n=1 Tax=Yarrowia lipolytica TaxID=4952 RepID=A0A371C1L9_YARLL|nr:2-oxoacid dehydrogenases acyltransferase-domain-containing protein [Yarrowia lipolytica]RDW31035.1 2-oxoacid dehydrogenases acyltransferase-domain-containing protein [Yarrowia lipolytica]RDW37877.1 2-oxoacid dehydrogenases acyltransferase-domain-containing protein [Yarrowia lipolytica]RDW43967.1 2-oxoacid dehydrogenases acyltransferase-domain-containing protein [Yarrowia lipolytica]RDW50698.1 2-oxoacid dehydrogenases acyltransferase-domain-containing protein [Yarrowia lipolytica]
MLNQMAFRTARVGGGLRTSFLQRRALHACHIARAVIPFKLADIGEGIKECEVIQWFVEPGARINEFDQICEVQSDKASVEITSRYTGVIKKLHYDAGDMALVGKPLVDIDTGESGEGASEVAAESSDAAPSTAAATPATPLTASASVASSTATTVSSDPSKAYQKALATPAVRRLTRELGIDIASIKGSGKGGRVMKEDVLSYQKGGSAVSDSATGSVTAATTTSTAGSRLVPLTPTQMGMFKTMTNSLSIPHFLYTDEVCLDKLMELRASVNSLLAKSPSNGVSKISYMPFFIKALSLALKDYPMVNAKVDLSGDKPAVLMRDYHNISIAMDTPNGLLVPTIKNVQDKTIVEIAADLQRLQELGMAGKLSRDDLTGGTISISNIGNVGGTYLSPVIVSEQVAIVGLGKARKLPRYNSQGDIVPEQIINASWSGDHRVLDGMTMALMADKWKAYVVDPKAMLLQLR